LINSDVTAVDTEEGKGEAGTDIREGLHDPFLGFIEEGAEFDPAGGDIGGVRGEAKRSGIPFAAVVDGVSLEEAGYPLVPG
jgi:hypothetical protein